MNSISRWTLDEEKEKDGVWKKLGNGEEIKVRPGGSAGNLEQAQHIMDALKTMGYSSPEDATENEMMPVVIESLALHVLVSWKGFKDENGKELKPTIDNKKMMLEKRLFRQRVLEEAEKVGNFLIEKTKDAVKN